MTFWPDATVFEETDFRAQTILERLQMMAFLNNGLEIRFVDEREGHEQQVTYRYTGGIVDFVRHLNASKESLFRRSATTRVAEETRRSRSPCSGTPATTSGSTRFANGISTVEGGMHEEGFKKALTNAINRYARAKGQLRRRRTTSSARTSARA